MNKPVEHIAQPACLYKLTRNDTTMEKAWNYTKEQLEAFLDEYDYYKPVPNSTHLSSHSLTDELDSIGSDELFSESTVLKILLWKVHRYTRLETNLLDRLNRISHLSPLNRTEVKPILEELLGIDGIDLPMASTLLRFRNPNAFQIIDRRAFRSVMESDQYDLYSGSSVERKVRVYFCYLSTIDKLCEQTGINFANADRILYKFDIEYNGALKKSPREGWEDQFRAASEVDEDPNAEAKEDEWLKSFGNEQ